MTRGGRVTTFTDGVAATGVALRLCNVRALLEALAETAARIAISPE